ncbi:MAG TPA: GFA family protein [Rhizomicrobium sp.]
MRQARCSCGQLRVVCEGEPAKVSICHCDACRLRTGSVFGIAVFYPREAVKAEGDQRDHTRKADSGRNVTFHFCPYCGSSVWWEPERMPDRVAVALGAFADPDFPMPDQSVNDARRYKWIEFPEAMQKRAE